MSAELTALIDTWSTRTVLVLGEAMLDCYLRGSADRLCPEAPVPVVTICDRQDAPGGAANTAANVAALGGQVQFLSVVGQDAEGDRLRQLLAERGLMTRYLIPDVSRITLAKQRVIADQQLVVRFDQGSTEPISLPTEQILMDHLLRLLPVCDAVLISDYGYGILTPGLIQALAQLQAQRPYPLVVDSKRLQDYRALKPTAVKPNYSQVIQLLGLPKQTSGRIDQILPYGDRILSLTEAAIATVTLDMEGTIVFDRHQPPQVIPAQPMPQSHAAGAGDTFVSALTLAFAAGASARIASQIAAIAASLVVQHPETTTCNVAVLRNAVREGQGAVGGRQ